MVIQLPSGRVPPEALLGQVLPGADPGVWYALQRVLGVGGMAVAYLAQRLSPGGAAPVVVKLMLPELALSSGHTALMLVTKEAVALSRLNEQVPPTPFVVRLVEAWEVQAVQDGRRFDIPWLAIEYVHGGAEGTTLLQRVRSSVSATGHAFDPARAALVMHALGSGLGAIHALGITHRDLKPENVLCCGYGTDELFKIADFGIARPAGVQLTFGDVELGTPGYAAPEQIGAPGGQLGPAADVFSFACVVFFALTGEEYFKAASLAEGLVQAYSPERRSLGECAQLAPDLRARPATITALDQLLAEATHAAPARRPLGAPALAARLQEALQARPSTVLPVSSERLATLMAGDFADDATVPAGWQWAIRHRSDGERVVRSVGWDGDGSCLAATNRGLEFWNGTSWALADGSGLPGAPRSVQRTAPGQWLVGSEGGALAAFSREGVGYVVQCPDPALSFVLSSGDLDGSFVAVAEHLDEPSVYTMLAGRWLAPARLPRARSVTGLTRLDAERWLIVGRALSGEGFAVLYTPRSERLERVPTPAARAYLACAARVERGVGLIVGAGGRTVRLDGSQPPYPSVVEGEPDLAAAAVDIVGNGWAAGAGQILMQAGLAPGGWRSLWSEPGWSAPFRSLNAQLGRVTAIAADGGIVEGQFLQLRG